MKNEMSIWDRVNAPMPKFFEQIFNGSAIVIALGGALAFFRDSLLAQGLSVPDWLAYVVGVAGSVAAVLAKLTMKHDS